MEFYFYPSDEESFKEKAIGNIVRTLVFDTDRNDISVCFGRKVTKKWTQTVKNNIESDHRVKGLASGNYQIYAWVAKSENDFGLPFHKK